MNKQVIVIGASENTERYSNKAIKMLLQNNYQVIALGNKQGKVEAVEIQKAKPELKNIYAITLYINKNLQKEYYDYIVKIKPEKIIFNPGTENEELKELAIKNNIEPIEACTLVMLSIKTF